MVVSKASLFKRHRLFYPPPLPDELERKVTTPDASPVSDGCSCAFPRKVQTHAHTRERSVALTPDPPPADLHILSTSDASTSSTELGSQPYSPSSVWTQNAVSLRHQLKSWRFLYPLSGTCIHPAFWTVCPFLLHVSVLTPLFIFLLLTHLKVLILAPFFAT